ncbi:MAG: Gfo/Idh/MocA family oxidoreductase [Pacificimonas sp.]
MIRIGLLGASRVAEYALIPHVAARDDCQIVAVAASDARRADKYAEAHDIETALGSYDELIAHPDIDLVYNALPPSQHARLSIAALKAGKAVLCEKPFAMDAGEARMMVAAAEVADRPLIEAFHYRYHPGFARLFAILAAREIGRIVKAEARFAVPIPDKPGELRYRPELGGGALMDLGCYCLHWLRMVLPEPLSVQSATARRTANGTDLETTAHMTAPNGAVGMASCAMDVDEPEVWLHLEGEGGTVRFENPLAPQLGARLTVRVGKIDRNEPVPDSSTYEHQLAHVTTVISDTAKPITGGADAIANMTLIDEVRNTGGGALAIRSPTG